MSTKTEEQHSETLKVRIARTLSHDIRYRVFTPGERLREKELAELFQVGRPLVREVLHTLEQEGLVELQPWKGARVAILSELQLSDLFDLVSMGFGLSARLAAERATEDQLSEIRIKIGNLENIVQSGFSLEEYDEARRAVHQAISMAEGPEPGLYSSRPLLRRIGHQFELDGIRTSSQRVESMHRWHTLMEFLDARDARGAECQASMMILSQRQSALEALRKDLAAF